MDSPEQTDHLELAVAQLRAELMQESAVSPEMISRLQAAVARRSADDEPLGWAPRVVVACLVYALIVTGLPADQGGIMVPMAAAIAAAYVRLSSWTGASATASSR